MEKMESMAEVHDVASLQEFVLKFKDFYEEKDLEIKDFREEDKLVKLALKEMRNPPNELQLSIATCAVQLLSKYDKQFFAWEGGQGKSRIMASIGLLALATNTRFKKVRFIFSNKLL